MASYDPDDPWADTAIDLSLYRLMPISPVEMEFITDSEIIRMAMLLDPWCMRGEVLSLTDECGVAHSTIV